MGNENTNYNNSNIQYVMLISNLIQVFYFQGEILNGTIKLTSKKVKFNTEKVTFRITQCELWNIPYIKSSITITNNLNSIINSEQPIIQNDLQEVYRNSLCYKNLIGDLSKREILQFNKFIFLYFTFIKNSIYDKKSFIRTFIEIIFNNFKKNIYFSYKKTNYLY